VSQGGFSPCGFFSRAEDKLKLSDDVIDFPLKPFPNECRAFATPQPCFSVTLQSWFSGFVRQTSAAHSRARIFQFCKLELITSTSTITSGAFGAELLQGVSVAVARPPGSDGNGIVSMFFLIRYQSVVARMRQINLARQLFRVSLANRREINVARQFVGTSLFIVTVQ
jgi:hypothetical protein